MPLLSHGQSARSIVEAPPGQSAASAADAEARLLAAAIARGDEAAFRTLYERYHSRLFRLAFVLGRGDESLAQDTVQSVFIIAARKLRRADSQEHLWNWLARVARQQLAKTWRQRQRGPCILTVEALPDYPEPTQPDAALEQVLDSALNVMDPGERQLIEAFYFDRRSQKELAEQLGTTPKAVSSRLERTREKLRSLIKRRLSHEA